MQIFSLVRVITGHFGNELLPPGAAGVLQGVVEAGLHGEEVPPVVFPELHLFQVIGAVQAVYEIGVRIKLFCRDRHDAGSVLHEPVTEAAVTHLHDELHVLSAAVFIVDLPAVEGHEAAELLDLLGHQKRANVLPPCPVGIGVPALRLRAETGIILVALGKQLRHAGLVPGIAGAADLVAPLRLGLLDVEHLLGQVFVHDVAAIGELKKFLLFRGHDFICHFSSPSSLSSLSPAPHKPERLHPTTHISLGSNAKPRP